MKPQNFDHLAEKVRNWGRWGAEDQRGTLNHIGPETLKDAVATVRSGKLFNLGLNFDKNGPQPGTGGRFNPKVYVTELFTPLNPAYPDVVYSDDVVHMPLQAATQWDALGHVHYDGQLYNGCDARQCLTEKGAAKMGIEHLATPGILSRGVLIDMARHMGVERLPGDYGVGPDDLNAACATTGVTIKKGDIVLVRTGHIQVFTQDQNRGGFMGMQPGVTHHCAEWVHDHSVSAVCADNMAVEILSPEGLGSAVPLAFHMLCLRDMGCPLGEMFNLDALAADCAQDGRYTFLLAAPLAVTNGFGSPVNPLALK